MIRSNLPVTEKVSLTEIRQPHGHASHNFNATKPAIAVPVETSATETSQDVFTSPTNNEDSTTYPEGGWTAWGVVLGSWLALFGSMSFMNSLGAFQAYLLRNQLVNYSPEAVGWIFGVFNGLTFLLGIQAGPIFDAKGPRGLIVTGGVLTVLYLMLLGICESYWHFMLVFGVIGGLSLSLIFGPAIAIISHYFDKRRGLATGVASSGGAVGGIIFPLMLQRMFDTVGFVWATRAAGIVCSVTFVFASILIRPRFPSKPITIKTIAPDLTILRHGGLMLTSMGVFFLEWGLFIPFTYLPSYSLDHGGSQRVSYVLMALINVGGILGRWIPGFLADRFGRFNLLILTVLGSGLSLISLWLPAISSNPMLILFALFFGFFSGANVSLAPVCVSSLCKVHSVGRYYSTAYVLVSISMFTGTALGGKILEVSQNQYRNLIIFATIAYMASFICFICAKVVCCSKDRIWSKM